MARTLGKHWSRSYPRGAYKAICSHCGVAWPSHKLTQEATGSWACPDDYRPGGDVASLSDANARDGERVGVRHYPYGAPPEKKETYS